MSGRPVSRASLLAALAAAASATALHVGVGPEVLLWFAPALLLFAPLLAGCFPGEARIHAHRRARSRPHRRRAAEPRIVGRREPRAAGRRGRLIAFRLAERGPPAAPVAA